MMKAINVYMSGVGGQGIGLLSEVLLRTADHAGYPVKAVDTHGLAQRGGLVVSHLRIGNAVFSPLVPAHGADLVVSLERHEALRALNDAARDGGVLVYYDTVWQPLDVRLNLAAETANETIAEQCNQRGIALHRVHKPDLNDARMQNIVVLAHIARHALIEGLTTAHFQQAMEDLMQGSMLEKNRQLFDAECRPGDGLTTVS
jgi:indolepyruvate ferredoxin oxidoreductase beta subunit